MSAVEQPVHRLGATFVATVPEEIRKPTLARLWCGMILILDAAGHGRPHIIRDGKLMPIDAE